MEHNSVLRPLYELKKSGLIDYTVVMPRNRFGSVDTNSIFKAVQANTKLIAITSSSNVTGIVLPYWEIGETAKRKGIFYLVDASQGAGSLPFDVKNMHISLLAFSGHKGLMGPQGTGGLYVDEGIALRPIIQGGTGSRSFETVQPLFMPDVIESGTLNTPGIAGLGAGVEFILKTGIKNIHQKKEALLERLYERLAQHNRIQLFSRVGINLNSGILALLIKEMDSSETGNILDSRYHIAVRSGFHCAPLAHKALRTEKTGLVRLSFGYFNSYGEIDYTADSIIELANQR
jgi:selenocysteine lyase/cysteine desulfurase